MSNLTRLLASGMLAASQAVYNLSGVTAASALTPSRADVTQVATNIKFEATAQGPLTVVTPPVPNWDQEVLDPLKAHQAALAEEQAAAARAAATRRIESRPAVTAVAYSLPAGTHADWMAAAGISPSDYGYVNFIFEHESGWQPWECNSTGYYCGLGQTSPSALAAACPNWQSDPVCQIRFFDGYVHWHGYGTWANAYEHWVAYRSW